MKNFRESVMPIHYGRPWILDLFCGAGGCAMGYYLSGFNVFGVDNKPQRNYPFRFMLADAMEYPIEGFAAVHASPPCQGYSVCRNAHGGEYPMLIPDVRRKLAGKPYIIENVIGAPLENPTILCGAMFGLKVYRHRQFETSFPVERPFHPPHLRLVSNGKPNHRKRGTWAPSDDTFMTVAGHFGGLERAREAMGIVWMNRNELAQAIPPAYTRFIGDYLLRSLVNGDLR